MTVGQYEPPGRFVPTILRLRIRQGSVTLALVLVI